MRGMIMIAKGPGHLMLPVVLDQMNELQLVVIQFSGSLAFVPAILIALSVHGWSQYGREYRVETRHAG